MIAGAFDGDEVALQKGGKHMPLIIFTHTSNAMPRHKLVEVAEQIRESMLRNYVIKVIPDALRAHTRVKIVEVARDCYIGTHDDLPFYDVELIGPIDSVAGKDAEAFAREITTAILTAEGSPVDDENAQRIWCVFNDVPDLKWSIGPKVLGRRSVLKHILQHRTQHAYGHQQAAE